jgi:lipoprotein NlpD
MILLVMVCWLTSCSSRTTPAPVIDIGAGKALSKKTVNIKDTRTYVVVKGDTLFSIAWYANKDYKTLARINNIAEPYRIYPNQTLLLKEPRKKKVTSKPVVQLKSKKAQKSESNRTKSNIVVDRPKKHLAGKLGSPVLATADGKVVYTGNALRGYGNLVIVKHNEDYLSAYAHNDEILVKEQQRVQTGQAIARMGNSGAQRTKLHFEIRYKGKSVDPLRYLPKHNNNK